MYDKLAECSENLTYFREMIMEIEKFMSFFEDDFLKDQALRNPALDAITDIIQSHKDYDK